MVPALELGRTEMIARVISGVNRRSDESTQLLARRRWTHPYRLHHRQDSRQFFGQSRVTNYPAEMPPVSRQSRPVAFLKDQPNQRAKRPDAVAALADWMTEEQAEHAITRPNIAVTSS